MVPSDDLTSAASPSTIATQTSPSTIPTLLATSSSSAASQSSEPPPFKALPAHHRAEFVVSLSQRTSDCVVPSPHPILPLKAKASGAAVSSQGENAPKFSSGGEDSSEQASDSVNPNVLPYKWQPDPGDAAQLRLRELLDRKNQREARRKARKKAATHAELAAFEAAPADQQLADH